MKYTVVKNIYYYLEYFNMIKVLLKIRYYCVLFSIIAIWSYVPGKYTLLNRTCTVHCTLEFFSSLVMFVMTYLNF